MGTRERAGTIFEVSPDGSRERPVTDFGGRPGYLQGQALATDGRSLYVTWSEDLGDLWVMDVVWDEDDGSDD